MERSLLVVCRGPGRVAVMVVLVWEVEGTEGLKVPWPRIHCGSVVMVSPGTRMRFRRWEEESLGRLLGRLLLEGASAMEVSLEESIGEGDGDAGEPVPKSSSESEGGRMVIPIA